jgi:hypothetical protein
VIGPALLGTLALHGADALERRLLGRRPAWDVRAMGIRLFGRPGVGIVLRWIYGPSLGMVQTRWRIPPLLYGPLIAAAELVAMPRVGATPPLRRWQRPEIPLLFVHATAFALAVAAADRFARR